MLAGRRYRLKLTSEQVEMAEEFGNICRSVWNTALEQRREYRRRVLVNPAYTSQTCHRCKEVDAGSRESQAVFVCTACGHTDHADVNAARNILNAAGHVVSACGDLGTGRSVKQEPAAPRGIPHQSASPLVGIPRL